MNATNGTLTGTAAPPIGGSPAEGAPVTHDRDKPVGFNAPESGNNGAARNAVFPRQLRDRGQSLLWLPFTRIDSFAQRGLNAPARRFGRAVRWHRTMIANTV